jgi:hypothetical protein
LPRIDGVGRDSVAALLADVDHLVAEGRLRDREEIEARMFEGAFPRSFARRPRTSTSAH